MVDPTGPQSSSAERPALFLAGRWENGHGAGLAWESPATGAIVWRAATADDEDVRRAVAAARAAFAPWAGAPHPERVQVLEAYARELEKARAALVKTIATDVGKPLWEADAEVTAMINKVPISIAAYSERTGERRRAAGTGVTSVRHRPHGVLAVFGPFNFPGHLANGHIVPALLAGNAVVFKPSEQAPLTAEAMIECWRRAGLPPGTLNLMAGGKETGAALAGADIDGILFTGSAATGALLHRSLADRPEKILALEMGGNNPLVVWDTRDLETAALLVVQSAYLTAGQRCTCARRLIAPAGPEGDALVERIAGVIDRIVVGPPDASPEPFMGPVISNASADRLLAAEADLVTRGARVVRAMGRVSGPWDRSRPFLSPGLLDVTGVADRPDEERFGPLLQMVRVSDFDAAIAEANRTRFGLVAGLLCDDPALWKGFETRARAGVVTWNRATTGAPSDAPFGGIGKSGNHRPSAYYAADACAYPVTSVEANTPVAPPVVRGLREP